jgi:NAD dependent epimerase/dehydratase family enzyme
VAPEPATNKAFVKALGRAMHRPALLPIPRFGPRLVLGGEMADEVLFASQRVQPRVLDDAAFAFSHPHLDEALREVLT